jgi:hypothetical protein
MWLHVAVKQQQCANAAKAWIKGSLAKLKLPQHSAIHGKEVRIRKAKINQIVFLLKGRISHYLTVAYVRPTLHVKKLPYYES